MNGLSQYNVENEWVYFIYSMRYAYRSTKLPGRISFNVLNKSVPAECISYIVWAMHTKVQSCPEEYHSIF